MRAAVLLLSMSVFNGSVGGQLIELHEPWAVTLWFAYCLWSGWWAFYRL